MVNFSDEYFLDQPFTSKINLLQDALEKYETRGGTALYDAVVASADELKRHGKLQKKILFVVTDGEDDASRESLEQAVRRLQEENGPTVYAIGLLGEERQRRAKRALETISERTGGIAFFPRTLDEVDDISSTVARDIRNQYTIGYKPTTPKSAGGYRTIRVDARAPGYGKLTVQNPQRLLRRPGAGRRRRKLEVQHLAISTWQLAQSLPTLKLLSCQVLTAKCCTTQLTLRPRFRTL